MVLVRRTKIFPGFIVLGSNEGVKGGPLNWSSGFLPAEHQGTLFRTPGVPILNLNRPRNVTDDDQRAQLDLMAAYNRVHLGQRPGDLELASRIESFELAYRMQTEAADIVDIAQETAVTRTMYGLDEAVTRPFGTESLLARRLVEQGVRFVQVYHDSQWDAHANLKGNHSRNYTQPTFRLPHCSPILRPAACSIPRWSSGAANSEGCLSHKVMAGVTITPMGSWPGWQARASRVVQATEKLMRSDTRPSSIP